MMEWRLLTICAATSPCAQITTIRVSQPTASIAQSTTHNGYARAAGQHYRHRQ